MPYDRYPAVDEDYLFPPEVRGANGLAPEFRNQVVPLTQTQRNNLTGDELWDGRLVMNLTTRRIDMYDMSSSEWLQMTTEPAGIVKEYGGAVAPDFHVLADGSVYPRTGVYAALFAVYGTQYNTGGELSTEFRVPNRRGRVAVMVDPGDPNLNALGKVYGAKTVTLTEAQIPSHDHAGTTGDDSPDHAHDSDSVGDHLHGIAMSDAGGLGGGGTLVRKGGLGSEATGPAGAHDHAISGATSRHQHAFSTDSAGGGGAHNNMQPTIAMNFIITL